MHHHHHNHAPRAGGVAPRLSNCMMEGVHSSPCIMHRKSMMTFGIGRSYGALSAGGVHDLMMQPRRVGVRDGRFVRYAQRVGGIHIERRVNCKAIVDSDVFSYATHCQDVYGIPGLVEFGTMEGAGNENGRYVVDMVGHRGGVGHQNGGEEGQEQQLEEGQEQQLEEGQEQRPEEGQQNIKQQQEEEVTVARLMHPQGCSVDICMHGGVVTRWQRSDGQDMLYLKSSNRYDGKEPIRGGMSVAWPQLGAGELPYSNGILQHLHWSVVETTAWEGDDDPRPSISLYTDSEDVASSPVLSGEFVHPFEAVMKIQLGLGKDETASVRERQAEDDGQRRHDDGDAVSEDEDEEKPKRRQRRSKKTAAEVEYEENLETIGTMQATQQPPFELQITFQVINKSNADVLTFTAGSMAHFATEDIRDNADTVKVHGLLGKYVLDYSIDPMRPSLFVENDHFVRFGKRNPRSSQGIERLYVDCDSQGDVFLCPGTQRYYAIENVEGYSDILVGQTMTSNAAESNKNVSMTSARKARPVRLHPGDEWSGEMKVTAYDRYWKVSDYEMNHETSGIPVPPRENALPPRGKSSDLV